MTAPVITIDGPSGSGKGTLSRLVAERLGWHWLDSGALYRLVALAALRRGMALDDVAAVAELARNLDVRFEVDGQGAPVIVLDGAPVGGELRTEQAGNAASRVAALQPVRDALLDRQRAFRQAPGLVADGRDMGTVVFSDAPLKVFLTASCEERARRRYKQLKEQGLSANLHALSEELAERDRRDAERSVAPLKPADDAVVLDSTHLDIESVLEQVLRLAEERNLT
ncbi:(d)CMP kinase [Thioalkalivibrio sulfidiphilus]|uniref:Cytidylate kinase n=1 Tax=Thioalkalivibrio sulfidiphilus (strain HL-EbGR7) TaxID=396588 RepID=B8GRS2_THISH|nr:(d)CMP kinase [Thioalkalivibrio sulfidiphilus]ACL72626.1 cytidylate kinase [Thioalkalivibrio sulfidiphilus HL-EbGr7]